MPFISTILSYDGFNPMEVVPKFIADVSLKKGEKVDYAIVKDGQIQILIECKKSTEPVKIEHASQLFRYFSVMNAKIAILTNGKTYQFFTPLDAPNKMDAKPFLVLDLSDIDESLIPELQKLSKDVFGLDSIISAAGELKYIGELKRTLAAQFHVPEDEGVKFLTARVYSGAYTQKVCEQFTSLVSKATKQLLNDQVNERLKKALGTPNFAHNDGTAAEATITSAPEAEADLVATNGIETTQEELDGYQNVRAIVCSEVKPSRVSHRDSPSYFAVFLEDNHRKPIARLHFDRAQKYLGIFGADKEETRVAIDSLDEIYEHTEALRATVASYL